VTRTEADDQARLLRAGSRWLMLSTVAVGGLNYAYTLMLLHLLRPADYSTFAAGQAVLLTAGSIAQCAVPWVLAHELTAAGTDLTRRRSAVSFAVLANTVGGLVAAAAGVAMASRFTSATGCLVVAASVLSVFMLNTTIGWLQAERRFGMLAVVLVSEVVLKVVAGLALVALGAGGVGALGAFAVGALLTMLVGVVCMRRDLRFGLPSAELRRSVRTAAAMTSMQGMFAVLANLDVLLVAVLPIPVADAASYQAAAVLGRIPVSVAIGISVVMFPLLAAAPDRGAVLRTAVSSYTLAAVFVTAALITVPAALLHLVVPSRFAAAHTLLPILAASGLCIGFAGLLTIYLQAIRRNRATFAGQAGGLLTAAGAMTLGWWFGGAVGLAIGAAVGAAANAAVLVVLVTGSGRKVRPVPLWSFGVLTGVVLIGLPLRSRPIEWLAVMTTIGLGCGYALLRARGSATAPVTPPEIVRPQGSVPALAEVFPGPHLFVSPHLDDGVLSCGALISNLRPEHEITVATVFSAAAPGPISLSARQYLRQYRSADPQLLYRLRQAEDKEILTRLGVGLVHLGAVDALFRRRSHATRFGAFVGRWLPELGLVYPTYRYHVIRQAPSRRDDELVRRITDEVMALVAARRPRTVFLPLGLGGHVDHMIVRSIGRACPDLAVYYADFPYSDRHAEDDDFARVHDLVPVEWRRGLENKMEMIKAYRSQYPSLFPTGVVPDMPERYFVPSARCSR
jgi:O-antigen/teichoic acid export membrane protein/LmbE family N-acetylglucosaminyl deacetylase